MEESTPVVAVAPPPAPPAPSAEIVAALSDVQGLRDEVKELRNVVERLEFGLASDLDRLGSRQADLYDDLDRRLKGLERRLAERPAVVESAPPAAPVAPPRDRPESAAPAVAVVSAPTPDPSAPTPPSTPSGGAAVEVPDQPAGAPTAPGAVPEVAVVQPPPVEPVPGVSARDAFDQAFAFLKQSRYADATQAFEAFVAAYPSSDLTDDAYYWMAEARYVTRQFEPALANFRTVIASFPSSQRIPASYLKIGYILYETGAYPEARQILTHIIKNFPTHRVAVSAETRLKKMDREGR